MKAGRIASLAFVLGMCLAGPVRAAEPAKAVETVGGPVPSVVGGRVFLDANANGRLDEGEKGLAGVAVTDSVIFVTTGDDGSYTIKVSPDPLIPYRPSQVVSVSWPSGKWPTGAWWRRLSDIKPNESVSFGLRDDEQKLPFSFAQGTDPHDSFRRRHNWVFRDDIVRMGDAAKFCVITGDLNYIGPGNYKEEFERIAEFTQNFPVPMFHTAGNHDLMGIHVKNWDRKDPLYGNAAWTRFLGPVRWSFNYAGVHVVGLDWAGFYSGALNAGIPDVTIDWLRKDLEALAAGTRTVMFVHHAWSPKEAFYDLAARHKVELILGGHSHRNMDMSFGGVKSLTTMSLYRLVYVTAGTMDIIDCCPYRQKPTDQHVEHCGVFLPPGSELEKNRSRHGTLENVVLSSGSRAVGDLRAERLEIVAEIEPATARRFGLRIAPPDRREQPLEIAFTGERFVSAAGVTTYSGLRPGGKSMGLHVFVADGMIKVYANNVVAFRRPFNLDKPAEVTVFAEDGAATFRKVDVWELKPKP